MRRNNSLVILIIGLLALNGCSWFSTRETFRDSWLIKVDNKYMLLTYTHYYRGGKSRSEYDYFRLIDPATGKQKAEAEYNVRSNNISEKFITQHSIFLRFGTEWECLKLKDLSLRWNDEMLGSMVRKKNKSTGKIHEVNFYNDTFNITTTVGETFRHSRMELEGEGLSKYYGGNPQYEEFINVHKDVKERHRDVDSLKTVQFTKAFTSYYNRSGYTLQMQLFLLEGDKRREIKILDTATFDWISCFPGKFWLNADFLRPKKTYPDYSATGIIVSSENKVFIYAHSSLEEDEDKPRLTCVDAANKKIIWDKSLEQLELDNDYKPADSYTIGNKLIVCWVNAERQYIITGMDITTGKIKWKTEE